MMNYRNTLNLPHTAFPMRGDLAKREPRILRRWNKNNLYRIIRNAKKGKKIFLLHDGPPYANGNIHLGHSVNKILKDIIIKSKGLTGYDSPYIPGWDCHGLPIELKVEQLIGKPEEKISSEEFRAACRRYAIEQIANQKKDFIRLGVLGDWEHPYFTMDFIIEAHIIRALSKLVERGHLYKGEKPIHWCINCRSALAEVELEYDDYLNSSFYVAFPSTHASDLFEKFGVTHHLSGPVSLVIWTTTVWTLPANRAITIHPDLDYHLVEVNGQGMILAAHLVSSVMQRIGVSQWRVIGSAKGHILELCWFQHPFMGFKVPSILGSHVTLDMGTGAVHTAPGHGLDDYFISKQYGLEVTNLVSADGHYLPGTFPSLDGLQVFKANEVLIDLLRDSGALLHMETLQHTYPHCLRHKTPVILRVTPQWFVSIDQHDLRKQSLKEIERVEWIPHWGKVRIENMVAHRPDWCISRQNTWGVPMSLFVHNETGALHPRTVELMEEVAKKVEKTGIQAWWDLDPYEILGSDAAYYSKVPDTLDVWFDSGSTHLSVVASRSEFANQLSDIYVEGSDQHRGWFMASLIISTIMTGRAPYRQVLTHGFTVDAYGRKMSKSVGNVVTPQQVIDKLGADILRLWVASTDYTGEITISDAILNRSSDTYRRIRNTARFILANLNDFNPVQHRIDPEKMIVLDQWAVGRAKITQEGIIAAYDHYDFHKVVKCIMQFCSVEMGSFYLEIIKDRQYTLLTNSVARRSCQTALYHIIEALVRWIAPIMSFTSDEIWSFIPGQRAQYVFTEEWYDNLFSLEEIGQKVMDNTYWDSMLQVRNEVNKVIEQARSDKRIGSTMEAHVTLYADPILATQLRQLGDELRFIFLTSSAVVKDYIDLYDANDATQINNHKKGGKKLNIVLKKAKGEKCSRCWHYELDIGRHDAFPDICDRCIINVLGPGEKRQFV